MTQHPSGRGKRHPALVALDVTAGVLLVMVSLGLSIGVVYTAGQYPLLLDACGSSGAACNEALLRTVVIALTAVAIFSFAVTAAMFIVNLIRRRAAWYWPLIGAVITVAAFYAGTALVSAAVS